MFLYQIDEPAEVGEWPRKAFLPQLLVSLPAEAEKIKVQLDECSERLLFCTNKQNVTKYEKF